MCAPNDQYRTRDRREMEYFDVSTDAWRYERRASAAPFPRENVSIQMTDDASLASVFWGLFTVFQPFSTRAATSTPTTPQVVSVLAEPLPASWPTRLEATLQSRRFK